jgi:hypothetical protein
MKEDEICITADSPSFVGLLIYGKIVVIFVRHGVGRSPFDG